jgi:hypothetical protein
VAGELFLTVWLDAALKAVREAREKLTHAAAQDSPLITRERGLIDEFVSVRLLRDSRTIPNPCPSSETMGRSPSWRRRAATTSRSASLSCSGASITSTERLWRSTEAGCGA